MDKRKVGSMLFLVAVCMFLFVRNASAAEVVIIGEATNRAGAESLCMSYAESIFPTADVDPHFGLQEPLPCSWDGWWSQTSSYKVGVYGPDNTSYVYAVSSIYYRVNIVTECDSGFIDVGGQCVEGSECEVGLEKYFSGQGAAFYPGPASICATSCEFNSQSVRMGTPDGYWYGKYTSTGNNCSGAQEGTEQTEPDEGLPPGCKEVNGQILCGAGTEAENCGTFNGVEVCTGSEPNCGYVNGEKICYDEPQNCGVVNGEKVCVQTPEPGQYGPQNSAPDGCFADSSGRTLCVNDDTVKVEDTTTTTTDNGDGTQTTTTTTNTTTNVKGEGTSTTTTVDDGHGNSTTTTTMSGNAPKGDGSGNESGDEGSEWGPYQGEGPGDLYTPIEKTYESVLTTFSNRIQAAPLVDGITGFFDINVSGSCPDWSIPATDMTPSISVTIQCTPAAMDMYAIAGLVIMAMAGFTAFRWAIL